MQVIRALFAKDVIAQGVSGNLLRAIMTQYTPSQMWRSLCSKKAELVSLLVREHTEPQLEKTRDQTFNALQS